MKGAARIRHASLSSHKKCPKHLVSFILTKDRLVLVFSVYIIDRHYCDQRNVPIYLHTLEVLFLQYWPVQFWGEGQIPGRF